MPKIVKVKRQVHFRIVADLASVIWNQHFVPIIGQDQVNYMLENFQNFDAISNQIEDGFKYYLLESKNNYVGYLGLVPDTIKNKMMISKFYILKEQRGAGHGKYLLDFVKKEAEKRNFKTVWLTVNRFNYDAINWYKRNGFAIISEKKADIGGGFFMDDYIMELKIKN